MQTNPLQGKTTRSAPARGARRMMKRSSACAVALALLLCLAAASLPANAQSYSVMYSFADKKIGRGPGPLLDVNGTFYGTTTTGGLGHGTIYSLSSSGVEKTLYYFPTAASGESPMGALIRDRAGNLYGVTEYGGDKTCSNPLAQFGCGIIFRLNTHGYVTVLHQFTSGNDGAIPLAGLVADTAGNLYGTTYVGGNGCSLNGGCGTVYKMTPSGTVTILHAFTGGTDGSIPGYGTLIIDAQGNLYGTTKQGGNLSCKGGNHQGCGVIFKIDPSGNETVLYAFSGEQDGNSMSYGVTADPAGNLYGTTLEGGDLNCDLSGHGCGTIFKLSTSGKLTVLYTFQSYTQNLGGASNVVLDAAGNLYGTTMFGGSGQNGTIFELSTQGMYSELYSFGSDFTQGAFPMFAPLMDKSGVLYGATEQGGSFGCSLGCGVLYKLEP